MTDGFGEIGGGGGYTDAIRLRIRAGDALSRELRECYVSNVIMTATAKLTRININHFKTTYNEKD